ncbi:MAG TPA: C40 family peptidase [Smithellaceae bacterium]|nr:C40 family peptidase [Smithellaceae bacterium]
MKRNQQKILILILSVLFVLSCSSPPSRIKDSSFPARKRLELMGYTIQAGAFAKAENAARLTETLKKRDIPATYFAAADGLFKVRFGNFSDREEARRKAQQLKDDAVIEDFYIVRPEDYVSARQQQYGADYVREALVKSARDFIGVPYLWGGASAETGFDCSGLTMTVYQLNGFNLPRHSARQFDEGIVVEKTRLQKGDLVFFAINGRSKISHVGIYIGENRFVHAPSRGKKIRIDSLNSVYYAKRFAGGRTYL